MEFELLCVVLRGRRVTARFRRRDSRQPVCSGGESLTHGQVGKHRKMKVEKSELTDCGDGGNNFTELKLVKESGLSGSVQTDHQDTHLLATP